MPEINKLNETAQCIINKVRSQYGDKVCNTDPKVFIYCKGSQSSDFFNDLESKRSCGVLGYTIKDTTEMELLKSECEKFKLPFNKRDVIIFSENCNENIIISVLAHELIHSMFNGIPHKSDKCRGFDEACTDYIACQIIGNGYFTSYTGLLQSSTRQAYLDYYAKFLSMSEEEKLVVLDHYFKGEPVE